MIRNQYQRLVIILLIVAMAAVISFNDQITITNPINGNIIFQRDVSPRLGLDLRGGLQVLLEADLPEDVAIDEESMQIARTIIENRTNALGVAENVLQTAGERRIVGEFPGLKDPDSVIAILQQTGLLEFVDTGDIRLEPGTIIKTDFGLTDAATGVDGEIIYRTIMTGKDLVTVNVQTDTLNQPVVAFTLSREGSQVFSDHTTANVGKILTIVLDKKVISSPSIESPITSGEGIIQGSFTFESANALAVQLRYGSLPIPLKIVESREIGPTLGADSLERSLLAGLIGIIIVILFMGIYYRLPGITADISILIYGLIAFAVFNLIGVTLTLPGIAGFMLSTGAALDANILVFERFKEELRNGKTLRQAFDQAWSRAWSSIRDSNIAVLITAGILYWFGSAFGATIVKGFSLTLALGVSISLFSALYITRTLLSLALDWFKVKNYERWFGI